MLQCWYDEPLRRPSFSDLIEAFNSLLLHANDGDYLQLSLAQTCCQNTGETLLCQSDTMSWTSCGDPPKPPMVLPTTDFRYTKLMTNYLLSQ